MKITENNKKTSEIMNEMRSKFKVWSWYTNEQLDKDFPPPKEITTREFADNVEADEEYKNMSANDLGEIKGFQGITLRERLLMEIQYFDKTGKHLDVDNITLCSGSRCSDGDVPYVGRDGDGDVNVGEDDAQDQDPYLRARRATLCDSSNLVPSDPKSLEARVTELERKMAIIHIDFN